MRPTKEMDTTDVIRGGKDQKNRGNNQQSIKHQRSNFTLADESLEVLMSLNDRRDKVQFIEFKESITPHVLGNFKQPSYIVKLINMGSIPMIPLPTFTKVMK